jgi:hypothetical protein
VPFSVSFFSTLIFSFVAAATNAITSMLGRCSRGQSMSFSVQKSVLSEMYRATFQRSSTFTGISLQPRGVWIVKPRRSSLWSARARPPSTAARRSPRKTWQARDRMRSLLPGGEDWVPAGGL